MSLYNRLGAKVKHFVRWWRRLDALVNQPLPTGRQWYWTLLAPDAYPWFVPLLTALLIAAMALGPTFRMGAANIGMLLLGLLLLLALHLGARRSVVLQQFLLAGQLTILVALALILLVLSPPEVFGDDSGSLRLHVGAALSVALFLSLVVVWVIARSLFRSGSDGTLARALPEVELFGPRDRYEFMGKGPVVALISALVIVPIRYPVELLLPGSLLILFLPDHYLWPVFLIVTAVTWSALFLGILFERLMEILKTIGRLFFIGPQFPISVLVIVVAALRLMDVHYITYLFNAGSGGYGNITLMLYVALTYVVAWFYAFWSDHFVARRLIRLLDTSFGTTTPLSIPYPYRGDPDLSPVEANGRNISLHGAGRLKIEGKYDPGYGAEGPALRFLTPAELLACLRAGLEQRPDTNPRRHPEVQAATADPLPSVRNLQRGAVVYPVITSAVAVLLIGGPACLSFARSLQPAELTINPTHPVDLDPSTLLLAEGQASDPCRPLGPDTRRIAVVASGGGTRAAIYTASVLRGLAEQGQICNVVLVSGVSGGSAALAYFTLHENELRRPGPLDEKAWEDFSEAMALPYIEYVIDGASDLRTVLGRWRWRNTTCGEAGQSDQWASDWRPARSRLGNILAESFVCKMGAGVMGDPPFGIMLNTAMLGRLDAKNPSCAAEGLSLAELSSQCDGDANVAGGRLVLTNLSLPPSSDAPSAGEAESGRMHVVTLNDANLSIARAAALSGNFPPIFPDAAIDVLAAGDVPATRYWVTDGGAVENRGAMTLYIAIREAMKHLPRLLRPPPPLRIVIADVSGLPGTYKESFGFSSVLGAGGQLALGMETEVFAGIVEKYCELGSSATVHELPMPSVLRNGGIGTHWLLPGSLSFTKPNDNERVTLFAADVKKIVVALHGTGHPPFDDPDNAEKVLGWATDDVHKKHWDDLLATLSNPDRSGAICGDHTKDAVYTP